MGHVTVNTPLLRVILVQDFNFGAKLKTGHVTMSMPLLGAVCHPSARL